MYITKNKIKTMDCIKCKKEIPPKRLEIIPNTKTCVNCSTESAKRGVPVMKGKGDHTWVELDIMSQEQYDELEILKNKNSKLDNLS
jgi:hypothetical protein|tara:strand:+ start:1430 stop:1687 length:258 start_codon:yes stop_codon:yes gene_type:complete